MVIPIELRRVLNIEEKDAVEIYVDDEKIILKKYVSSEVKQEAEAAVKELEAMAKNADEKTHSILVNAMRLLRQK